MSINEQLEWRDTSPDYIEPDMKFEEDNKLSSALANKDSFMKFDSDKPKYHLIDAHWYEDVAKVMTMGANKYAENNWKLNKDMNRYISSLERHLAEIKKGMFMDSESLLQHTAHISCNAMFLHYLVKEEND